jgi:RNA polymerase sigma-70 factor (ECF subfamily)
VRKSGVSDQRAGFAAFYEASKDACLRAVGASVSDRGLAEEIVAEAFSRAWVSWATVSRHPSPAAWVVRTALNVRVSWWRRQRRELPLTGYDASRGHDPEQNVGSDLMTALGGLSVRQREVVTLRLLLDLDTQTTAETLGIAPGTVTAHLARAVSTLRRQLPAPQSEPLQHHTEVNS